MNSINSLHTFSQKAESKAIQQQSFFFYQVDIFIVLYCAPNIIPTYIQVSSHSLVTPNLIHIAIHARGSRRCACSRQNDYRAYDSSR